MKVEIDSEKLKDLFLNNGLSTKRSDDLTKKVVDKTNDLIKIKEKTSIKNVSEISISSRGKKSKEEVTKNDNISV